MSRANKRDRLKLRRRRVRTQHRRASERVEVARERARARRPDERIAAWDEPPAPPPEPEPVPQPEPAPESETEPSAEAGEASTSQPEPPTYDDTMPIDGSRFWQVVQVKAGWVHEARLAMAEAGAQTFRPMRSEAYTGVRGRRCKRRTAFLGRGVFVGVTRRAEFKHIAALWMVEDEHPWMTVNGRTVVIDPAQLEQFRQCIDDPTLAEDGDELAIGDQVRILDGPFASFNGVVEAILPHQVAKVSISIFGRATPADLRYSQLQRA